ncbi:tRNA lysidine(34) synthetase TilS [Desulfosporosinus youngiae]|uniref:tRNA(Ile)-lysidine synthase n=1 Tax=Desulfosporosinus youngiae DSM 17734 TaxID=768710 RepID=H5XRR1_9FIRM|nr:tRNA lysidine(34) synthetase TilS [Desulfosporosinus youngiae]EHQ87320.1 tRNA(Ile)-lysidine synthetase [Desulfosporosinus youngiae DSM 17734]
MYEQLRKYILPELIPSGTRVMVAVSGGPDSMALSHLLWRYTQEESSRGVSIVLTHVHHGVRRESDAEAVMVQDMAKKWNVPCLVHRFNAKRYAESMGQSFQEAAREWRYARWKEDMLKEGCSLLATAHHLGDQAETILYRLLRGSGTAGLAGMYPSKGSIIRPLLSFTKADILNYCAREAVPYALDDSNQEPVYVRNRIRLELLPELERSYNSRIQETLGRTGELLRWDEEYITRQVKAAWDQYHYQDSQGTICLKLDVFKEPAAILSRLLRKAAMQVTQEPRGLGFTYVAMIMAAQGKPGWSQDLPGMRVKLTDEGLQFCRSHIDAGQKALNYKIPLVIGQSVEIPGSGMVISLLKEWNLSSVNSHTKRENKIAVFSSDLLTQVSKQSLVCRTRQEGDKMWFKGVGHKSLKKVFQEAKIADDARNRIPLIADEAEVLWIPGVRQSGLYRADNEDEKIVCILTSRIGRSI